MVGTAEKKLTDEYLYSDKRIEEENWELRSFIMSVIELDEGFIPLNAEKLDKEDFSLKIIKPAFKDKEKQVISVGNTHYEVHFEGRKIGEINHPDWRASRAYTSREEVEKMKEIIKRLFAFDDFEEDGDRYKVAIRN